MRWLVILAAGCLLIGCGGEDVTGTPAGLYRVQSLEVRACDAAEWAPCDDCLDFGGWIRTVEARADRVGVGPCPPDAGHCDVFWQMGGPDAPYMRSGAERDGDTCAWHHAETWLEPIAADAPAQLEIHRQVISSAPSAACPVAQPADGVCRHERLRATWAGR